MKIKSVILLLITAIVWGLGFVAQSEGMEYVGTFTFTCVRSLIGGCVLIPIVLIRKRKESEAKEQIEGYKKKEYEAKVNRKKENEQKVNEKRKNEKNAYGQKDIKLIFVAGVSSGVLLAIAQNLQQIGITKTTVGKAGFITAMYIVLVPIFGLFLKKKTSMFVWIGVVFATLGLYLLNMTSTGEGVQEWSIGFGEIMVLLCAVFFALQILVIDHFLPKVDDVTMACIQFFVCGILSGIVMIVFEQPQLGLIKQAWLPILYAGIGSTGIGYTLQIVGQKGLNPTVASLIMSLESVFAVLGGFVILHERLTLIELIGCACMMAAIIFAQLPQPKRTIEKKINVEKERNATGERDAAKERNIEKDISDVRI